MAHLLKCCIQEHLIEDHQSKSQSYFKLERKERHKKEI